MNVLCFCYCCKNISGTRNEESVAMFFHSILNFLPWSHNRSLINIFLHENDENGCRVRAMLIAAYSSDSIRLLKKYLVWILPRMGSYTFLSFFWFRRKVKIVYKYSENNTTWMLLDWLKSENFIILFLWFFASK